MMKGMALNKHFSLTSSSDVAQICDGILESIGINYFNYIKVYEDSSRELLTNNAPWIEHFYKQALYHCVAAIDVEHLLPKGYFLWSELDNKDPIYLQGRDFFNIDNGISFIIKREDVSYLYIFASSRENHTINNFYVKNIDLLKRFIHYFNDKAKPLMKKAAQNKIYLPEKQTIQKERVNNIVLNKNMREAFIKKTKIDRYYLLTTSDDLYLTRKQAECATFYAEGASLKSIATKMTVSPRTVESYLNDIKLKISTKKGRPIGKDELRLLLKRANIA